MNEQFQENVNRVLEFTAALFTQGDPEAINEITSYFGEYFQNAPFDLINVFIYIQQQEIEDNMRHGTLVILNRELNYLIKQIYYKGQGFAKDENFQNGQVWLEVLMNVAFCQSPILISEASRASALLILQNPPIFNEIFIQILKNSLENTENTTRFVSAMKIFETLADAKYWKIYTRRADDVLEIFFNVTFFILKQEFIESFSNDFPEICQDLLYTTVNCIRLLVKTQTEVIKSEQILEFLKSCPLFLPIADVQLFGIIYQTFVTIVKKNYKHLPVYRDILVMLLIKGLDCSEVFLHIVLESFFKIGKFEFQLYENNHIQYFVQCSNRINKLQVLNESKTMRTYLKDEDNFVGHDFSKQILTSENVLDALIGAMLQFDDEAQNLDFEGQLFIPYAANKTIRYMITLTEEIFPKLMEIIDTFLHSDDWKQNYVAILLLESLSSIFDYNEVCRYISSNITLFYEMLKTGNQRIVQSVLIFLSTVIKTFGASIVQTIIFDILMELISRCLAAKNPRLLYYSLKFLSTLLAQLRIDNKNGKLQMFMNLLLEIRATVDNWTILAQNASVLCHLIYNDTCATEAQYMQIYNQFDSHLNNFLSNIEFSADNTDLSTIAIQDFEVMAYAIVKMSVADTVILNSFMQKSLPFFASNDAEYLRLISHSYNVLFVELKGQMQDFITPVIQTISRNLDSKDPMLIKHSAALLKTFLTKVVATKKEGFIEEHILPEGSITALLFKLIWEAPDEYIPMFQVEIIYAIGAVLDVTRDDTPLMLITNTIELVNNIIAYEFQLESKIEKQQVCDTYASIFYLMTKFVKNVRFCKPSAETPPEMLDDANNFFKWFKTRFAKFVKKIHDKKIYNNSVLAQIAKFVFRTAKSLTNRFNLIINRREFKMLLQTAQFNYEDAGLRRLAEKALDILKII